MWVWVYFCFCSFFLLGLVLLVISLYFSELEQSGFLVSWLSYTPSSFFLLFFFPLFYFSASSLLVFVGCDEVGKRLGGISLIGVWVWDGFKGVAWMLGILRVLVGFGGRGTHIHCFHFYRGLSIGLADWITGFPSFFNLFIFAYGHLHSIIGVKSSFLISF